MKIISIIEIIIWYIYIYIYTFNDIFSKYLVKWLFGYISCFLFFFKTEKHSVLEIEPNLSVGLVQPPTCGLSDLIAIFKGLTYWTGVKPLEPVVGLANQISWQLCENQMVQLPLSFWQNGLDFFIQCLFTK